MAYTASLTPYGSNNIQTGEIVQAPHVYQFVRAFTAGEAYDILISGSLTITGSTQLSGSLNIDGLSKSAQSVILAINNNGEVYLMDTSSLFPIGSLLGNGSNGYIPLWSGSSYLTSSVIYQSGNNIGINATNPTNTLTVSGGLTVTGSTNLSGSINVVGIPSNNVTTVLGIDNNGNISITNASSIGALPAGQDWDIQLKSGSSFSVAGVGRGFYNNNVGAWTFGNRSNGTIGSGSFVFGSSSVAIGDYSVAEGQLTQASASNSHAEGYLTTASGLYSHVEGQSSVASGESAHAEGAFTNAIGPNSHAGGYYTIASGSNQTAIGQYNKQNNTTDLFIIGSGSGDLSRFDLANFGNTIRFNKDTQVISNFYVTGSSILSSSLIVTGSTNLSGSLNIVGPNVVVQPRVLSIDSSGNVYLMDTSSIYASGSFILSPAGNNWDIQLKSGSSLAVATIGTGSYNYDYGAWTFGIRNTVSSSTPLGYYSFAINKNNIALGSHSFAQGNLTFAADDSDSALGYGSFTVNNILNTLNLNFTYNNSVTTLYSLQPGNYVTVLTSLLGNSSLLKWYYNTTDNKFYELNISTISYNAGTDITQITLNTSAGSTDSSGNGNIYYQEFNSILKGSPLANYSEGEGTIASGDASHAEGKYTLSTNEGSHAEGFYTEALGVGTHAEGKNSISSGSYSHAEGEDTVSIGEASHAEGYSTSASGDFSHAEGNYTTALGESSHAQGKETQTIGTASYAGGSGSIALGNISFAQGMYVVASGSTQSVIGQYNLHNNTTDIFVIGSGSDDNNRLDLANFGGIIKLNTTTQVSSSLIVSGSTNLSGSLNIVGPDTIAQSKVLSIDSSGNVYLMDTSSIVSQTTNTLSPAGNDWDVQLKSGSGFAVATTGTGSFNYDLGAWTFGNRASISSSQAIGSWSFVTNYNNLATGQYSVAQGYLNFAADDADSVEGYNTATVNNTVNSVNLNFNYSSSNNILYSVQPGNFTSSLDNDLDLTNAGLSKWYYNSVDGQYYEISVNLIDYDVATNTTYITLNNPAGSEDLTTDGNVYYQLFSSIIKGEPLANHAEGEGTIAAGDASHAEGKFTEALNEAAHAEGSYTNALGIASHAEGKETTALGDNSHTEGETTYASGSGAHAEGYSTSASGDWSHAEGYSNQAIGEGSHAEGGGKTGTIALGNFSHAEGNGAQTTGYASHAEGSLTQTIGSFSHAEGYITKAIGESSHAEGSFTYSGYKGFSSNDAGQTTPGEIVLDSLYGDVSALFTNGNFIILSDTSNNNNYGTVKLEIDSSTFDGTNTIITLVDTTISTTSAVIGVFNTPEPAGADQIYIGDYSHAEGNNTQAIGWYSHAEGNDTKAVGDYSHAEGTETQAIGDYSHAEGNGTQAIGYASHAEGEGTQAIGYASHTEGNQNIVSGSYSHVEGELNINKGNVTHVEGKNNYTFNVTGSHVEGYFNVVGATNIDPFTFDFTYFSYYYDPVSSLGPSFTTTGPAFYLYGNKTSTYSGGQNVLWFHGTNAAFYFSTVLSSYYDAGTDITQVALTSDPSSNTQDYFSINNLSSGIYGGYIDTYDLYSHVEGTNNYISKLTTPTGSFNNGRGSSNVIFDSSFTNVKGKFNYASNLSYTNVEGYKNQVNLGFYNYIKGRDNNITFPNGSSHNYINSSNSNIVIGNSNYNYIEGDSHLINAYNLSFNHIEGQNNTLHFNSQFNHVEGANNTLQSSSQCNHVEGINNTLLAFTFYNHVEGTGNTLRSGSVRNHVEGSYNIVDRFSAFNHIEGAGNYVSSSYVHAEGLSTSASAQGAHAEGFWTKALGEGSHAEGSSSIALGSYSHAAGLGTIASGSGQVVVGKWNRQNNTTDLFVVGSGSNNSSRGDAFGVSTDRMYASSSVYFPRLTTSATANNVLTFNAATGQLFYTASSAIGGGSAITVYDEGNLLTSTANSFDFVGNAVTATNVGNAVTVTINTGSAGGANTTIQFNDNGNFSGSGNFTFNKTTNIVRLTGSFIATGSTEVLTIIGSGSSAPVVGTYGSQGQLLTITDTLTGSLFSVRDISGIPVLGVNSDSTITLGSYATPALFTTTASLVNSGINLIYTLSTSSYNGAFIDYTAMSGSVATAGTLTAIWIPSSGSINSVTSSTADINGPVSGLFRVSASLSGGNVIIQTSASLNSWNARFIIKSI